MCHQARAVSAAKCRDEQGEALQSCWMKIHPGEAWAYVYSHVSVIAINSNILLMRKHAENRQKGAYDCSRNERHTSVQSVNYKNQSFTLSYFSSGM